MSQNTRQQIKGQAELATALDAAYEAARAEGFPYCDDYELHDAATCLQCRLREARSAYRACKRAVVIARLAALEHFVFPDASATITPSIIIESRRRKRDRARIAYEHAIGTTPRPQVDAAAALELAELEFEVLYEKYLADYIPEQADGFRQDFAQRFAELDGLDFIIPQDEWQWRMDYLQQEEAMWLAAHNADWRLRAQDYVERRGSEFAKQHFAIVMMHKPRRIKTVGDFASYLEGLQMNEKFRRWAERQGQECVR